MVSCLKEINLSATSSYTNGANYLALRQDRQKKRGGWGFLNTHSPQLRIHNPNYRTCFL